MSQITTYNAKDTFPSSTALTGTVTSVNRKDKILGVGTLFTSELQTGDYLYSPVNSEVREIIGIVNDLELTIDSPFTADLAAESARKTPPVPYTFVSIKAVGGDCDIDGQTHTINDPVGFERNFGSRRPKPLVVDPSSTALISYMS